MNMLSQPGRVTTDLIILVCQFQIRRRRGWGRIRVFAPGTPERRMYWQMAVALLARLPESIPILICCIWPLYALLPHPAIPLIIARTMN